MNCCIDGFGLYPADRSLPLNEKMQDKAHLKLNTDRLICNYEKEISLKFFVEIQCVLRIALTDVAGR